MRGTWGRRLRALGLGLGLGLLAPASAAAAPGWEAGVIAPYGTQPGVRAGLTVPLMDGERLSLSLRPHLGLYARSGNHMALLTDLTLGVDRTTQKGRARYGAELGLGYSLRRQRTSAAIDLGTGDKTWSHELRHAAVPMLALSAGGTGEKGPALFGRVSVGQSLSVNPEGATFFMIELGLRGAPGGGR
jgi:hypothetical protein